MHKNKNWIDKKMQLSEELLQCGWGNSMLTKDMEAVLNFLGVLLNLRTVGEPLVL